MVRPPPGRAARRPPRQPAAASSAGIASSCSPRWSACVALANRSAAACSPDFLTEFVLYALSAADLTMLVALVFVLARNIIKLIVERRRALPFARFRAKLVAVLLGMTLIPAVLVLLVGSELIRNSVDRWFNAPMDDMLSAADCIASDYYQRAAARLAARGTRLAARASAGADVQWRGRGRGARSHRCPTSPQDGSKMVEVYRVTPGSAAARQVDAGVSTSPRLTMPRGYARAVADRLAAHAASGRRGAPTLEHAAGRRRADSGRGRRAAARDGGRRPASWLPAITSPASSRRRARRMTRRLRGLQAAARAEAAAGRRLPLVLPDGHADDSGRRDVDGAVPGEAHHAARAACSRRPRRRSAPAI